MAVIDTLNVNLQAITTGLTKGLSKGQNAIASFASKANSALSGVTTAFAGIFSVGAAKSFIQDGLQLADEINDTAASLQISSESFNRLRHAAEMSDVPIETLTMGLKQVAKLGIDPERGLLWFSDQISQMPDKFQRAAQATDVFGKAGIALLPLLNQGSANIKKMGDEVAGAFSDKNVAAMNDADNAMKDLAESWRSLKIAVATEISPDIKAATEWLKSKKPEDTRKLIAGQAEDVRSWWQFIGGLGGNEQAMFASKTSAAASKALLGGDVSKNELQKIIAQLEAQNRGQDRVTDLLRLMLEETKKPLVDSNTKPAEL
jgi:hypothetical protein